MSVSFPLSKDGEQSAPGRPSAPAPLAEFSDADQSLERQAIQRIVQESTGGSSGDASSKLTLPMLATSKLEDGDVASMNEKERLLHDVRLRPAEATLDDYNRIPVEEFGVALLRGMGWKEGMAVGRNVYDEKYAFLFLSFPRLFLLPIVVLTFVLFLFPFLPR